MAGDRDGSRDLAGTEVSLDRDKTIDAPNDKPAKKIIVVESFKRTSKTKNSKEEFLSSLPPPSSKSVTSARQTVFESPSLKEKPCESHEEGLDDEKAATEDEFEDIGFFDAVEVPKSELLESKAQTDPQGLAEERPYLPRKRNGRATCVDLKEVQELTMDPQIANSKFLNPSDSLCEFPEQAAILRRSKETAIEVKEISQEDMLKDRLKYQTLDVTTGAASVPSMRNNYIPGVSMKRKHNIISLAYESRLNMQALEEARSQSRATRKIARQEYGF